MKRAVCLTNGERAENHVGMQMLGDGLAEKGYSLDEMREIAKKFDAMGGVSEWIDLNNALDGTDVEAGEAAVLLMKNGANVLFKNRIRANLKEKKDPLKKKFIREFSKYNAQKLFEEQFTFEWDKQFWNSRRNVVQNKHARYNVCYGDVAQNADFEKGKGSIISYSSLPIMQMWRKELFKLCGENDSSLHTEGNLYYDLEKTGIGFHGDGERRKVVAGNFSDNGVVREINWIWYHKGERIGERTRVFLENGDMYIMSEKAAGTDWKKRIIPTLRHAAAVEGTKAAKRFLA